VKKGTVVFKVGVSKVMDEKAIGSLSIESDGYFILIVLDLIYTAYLKSVFLSTKASLRGYMACSSNFSIRRYLNGIKELEEDGWIVLTQNKEGVDILLPCVRLLNRYDGVELGIPHTVTEEESRD
jgi:hypothetical protein